MAPRQASLRWVLRPWILAVLLVLAVAGLLGRWAPWEPTPPPEPRAPLATEQEILADAGRGLRVFRLAANPEVLVLSFGTLEAQGRMLNRLAALVEKAGLPRDRLLDDAELAAAIEAAGATAADWYFGHDYRAADLRRFFALAREGGVRLTPEEQALRDLMRREGLDRPGSNAVVVSVPGAAAPVDAALRAAILRHELSHAAYFSNPDYAAHVRRFWAEALTEEERAAWRRFLAQEGYEAATDDLAMNEMQAYLAHTPDPRLFDDATLGLPAERVARMRAAFLAGMPTDWPREATPSQPAPQPAAAPRRGAVTPRPGAAGPDRARRRPSRRHDRPGHPPAPRSRSPARCASDGRRSSPPRAARRPAA
ncbi:hypothetical protein [Falsiroseomonas sp.]|uniref:hypothetical protein n=1 Tax=Falsiroseomonas sp. TaxID=2870721 RepID=UPI00356B1C7D